jgi:hypothetical protein
LTLTGLAQEVALLRMDLAELRAQIEARSPEPER